MPAPVSRLTTSACNTPSHGSVPGGCCLTESGGCRLLRPRAARGSAFSLARQSTPSASGSSQRDGRRDRSDCNEGSDRVACVLHVCVVVDVGCIPACSRVGHHLQLFRCTHRSVGGKGSGSPDMLFPELVHRCKERQKSLARECRTVYHGESSNLHSRWKCQWHSAICCWKDSI
jgi:hypothetical protein